MKVYTKTGDKGTSQLFSGERRPKDDAVFEALGAVDECNAFIGLARECLDTSNQVEGKLGQELEEVMSRLFDVGSAVATPIQSSSDSKLKRAFFQPEHTDMLEKSIDAMDMELPPLKNFILPSGGKCAAHLHVARTLSRRAERRVVVLVQQEQVEPSVGVYMNRLSDYLFTAARFVAMKQNFEEKIYKKPK
eukprot:CAMPEP_0204831744 /NCGR_PEP_ID=MMETSP1346-20131115/11487_1 /ASSEMBLY_ACC=CAM_ASM_000771 /TAXON_ID=215587 /ORGANISM="Aplanochytrium stocchinoi, Strain GSBS06" /LENGTH=190 /DNA_ID=CAMNT_0051963021 /DNA_START=291 /DNA_END=863 /DNA_ORIENTATION=+